MAVAMFSGADVSLYVVVANNIHHGFSLVDQMDFLP